MSKEADYKTILATYEALDQQQKDFIVQKKIDTAMTVDKWLKFFKRVNLLDTSVEALRKQRSGKTTLIFLSAGISLALGFFIHPLIYLLIIVSVVFGIISANKDSKLKKIDAENTFKDFVAPVLSMMSQDIAPQQKVAMAFEANRFTSKDRTAYNVLSNYPKIELSEYHKTWFNGSTTLADSTDVKFTFSTYKKEKKKTKYKTKGRTKVKRKEKIMLFVEFELSFDKNSYDLIPSYNKAIRKIKVLGALATKVKCGEKNNRIILKVKSGFLSQKVDAPSIPASLAVMGQAYQLVTHK